MSRLTVKSSTILISMGEKTQIYHSLEEVPARLRKKLVDTTSGANSATILIADRAGRDELVKALGGEQSHLPPGAAAGRRVKSNGLSWRHWAEILLPGLLGLGAWLLLTLK